MSRPKALLLLIVVLLGFAAFNGQGAVSGWQQYAFLSRLALSVSPVYLLVSDAVWAMVFTGAAIGLWFRQGWARTVALIAMPFYFGQGWFNRLVLTRSDYAQLPLGWTLMWTLIWVGLVWGILWREKVRQSFQLNGGK